MNKFAVETKNVEKTYSGNVQAVQNLNLRVKSGNVCGLIGPNGAGKTTILRILMGLINPDRGVARVFGQPFRDAPPEERMRVGYVPQELQLRKWMTPAQLSSVMSCYYRTWDEEYAQSLANTLGIDWETPIGAHSGGQQQKIAILRALASRPDLLILDEPTAGLDPAARRTFIDLLVELLSSTTDCTILYSTHLISDLERVVEDVVFLHEGTVSIHEPLDRLKERFKKVQVVSEGGAPPEDLRIPGAVKTETSGAVVTALVELNEDSALDTLKTRSDVRVNTTPLGLEDLFIELFQEENIE